MSASSRLQRRALHRAAGEAAVVVEVAHRDPALVLLAGDVGLAGLALGIERVELLLEPLLGGLAGVDGAGDAGHPSRLRNCFSCSMEASSSAIRRSHDRRAAARFGVACPSAATIVTFQRPGDFGESLPRTSTIVALGSARVP